MKVFFDTNVYVAEAMGGRGSKAALDATVAARWRIYLSEYVLDELQRTLARQPNFSPKHVAYARKRARLRATTLVESMPSRHGVPGDPADTPILRAALAAGADYIVTNDRHFLSLDPYETLRVMSLATYIDLLKGQRLL